MGQSETSCTKLGKKLGVSRQRAWQIIQNQDGKCRLCYRKLYSSDSCKYHHFSSLLQQRLRYHPKHRIKSKYGSIDNLKKLMKEAKNEPI